MFTAAADDYIVVIIISVYTLLYTYLLYMRIRVSISRAYQMCPQLLTLLVNNQVRGINAVE